MKKKLLVQGIEAGLAAIVCGLVLTGAYLLWDSTNRKAQKYAKFNPAYSTAIQNHADTNEDGIITEQEKKDLTYRIIVGKGKYILEDNQVYNCPNWPKDLEGQSISTEEFTTMIEDYNSAN